MLERSVVMIGGKGGVSKTTCAAALALQCARSGERTLVVSEVSYVLVLIPEALAVHQVERILAELTPCRLMVGDLIINGGMTDADPRFPVPPR